MAGKELLQKKSFYRRSFHWFRPLDRHQEGEEKNPWNTTAVRNRSQLRWKTFAVKGTHWPKRCRRTLHHFYAWRRHWPIPEACRRCSKMFQVWCQRFVTDPNHPWLVVWTPLKNISQLGWLFPIYGKIKNGNQTTNQIHCLVDLLPPLQLA